MDVPLVRRYWTWELVEFTLNTNELGFYDENMNYIVEPGLFKLWIGPNSSEGIEGSFEIIAHE